MKLNLKRGMFLMAVVAMSLAVLTSCSSAQSGSSNELYVYNWGDYINPDILPMFEQETGISIKYDTFPSNEEMYNKIKSGGTNYDIAIPSDYMIEKMIKEDMLEKINIENIPNYKHIDNLFKNLPYDPNNEYSIAYMWGTIGILYNTDMVDDVVDSWDILWNDKYKKQIFMYDSVRDAIGPTLKKLGYSLNSRDENQLREAKEELIKQAPLVQAYVGDAIKDKMIGNEGALAIVYSGDAMFCIDLNDSLDYVVPKEGSNYWYDGIVIPKGSKNKEAAEKFIDFLCRPDIAAKNSEYIGFSTANKDALPFLDPEMVNNPIFWPADEVLQKCELYADLGDFTEKYYEAWTEILMQ